MCLGVVYILNAFEEVVDLTRCSLCDLQQQQLVTPEAAVASLEICHFEFWQTEEEKRETLAFLCARRQNKQTTCVQRVRRVQLSRLFTTLYDLQASHLQHVTAFFYPFDV